MNSPDEPRFVRVGGIPFEEAESTLDETCSTMVGRLVYVGTINGHGWQHFGHSHYPSYPAVPEPFHARIDRFYSFRKNPRRGFFATVVEPGHPFDWWQLICCTRHVGRFNFTDPPAAYNLLVSRAGVRLGSPADPRSTAHWPAFYRNGDVYSFGFADIAETADHLATWFEALRRERSS